MNEPERCPGPSAPARESLGCVEERVEQHGAELAPHGQALGRAELQGGLQARTGCFFREREEGGQRCSLERQAEEVRESFAVL